MTGYVIRARIVDTGIVRLPIIHETFEAALEAWRKLLPDLDADVRGHARFAVVAPYLPAHRAHPITEAAFAIPYARPVRVGWFDVRAIDDPSASSAPIVRILILDRTRGTQSEDSITRRWAEAHGYHGHVGGWKYAGPPLGAPDHDRACSYPRHIAQGWASFRRHVVPTGQIVAIRSDEPRVHARYHLASPA